MPDLTVSSAVDTFMQAANQAAMKTALALAKADVGLGNADNTSDAAKPISTATQTALDLKAAAADLTAHTGNTSNPHSVTKSQVGLGNVTNDAQLKAADLDTDGTLAANSDTKIPSQKAVKTYADQLIAAADAMVFKGVVDCSANPNYPAADRGHTYKVSVSGKIGGASGLNVEAGDTLLCITDGTASGNQATVGDDWCVVQANLDGVVIGPPGVTDSRVALFDGTTGKLIKQASQTIADLLARGNHTGTQSADTLTDGSTNKAYTATEQAKLAKLHAQGSDIASASTVDLDTATGDLVDITGTTTITALTLSQGIQRVVRFTGALTLTNDASLVLPGGANITTAAGDFAIFRGYASSVVRCIAYTKANGEAVVGGSGGDSSPVMVDRIINGPASYADSTDYAVGVPGTAAAVLAFYAAAQVAAPVTGTVNKVSVTWRTTGTTGSSETVNLYVRKNGSTDSSAIGMDWSGGTGNATITSLGFAVTAGDLLNIKLTSPAWATNPTNVYLIIAYWVDPS